MDQIEYKQSEYGASRPVHGQRQKEWQPNVPPGLYVRPELRREGDVRDVTLGGSFGPGESNNPTVFKNAAPEFRGGFAEGEGFVDEPEQQGEKEESSSGEGAAFRNP